MNQSPGRFCRLYRPVGALLLLLAILFLQLRSCNVQTPVAVVPTEEPPTAVPPTAVPPTVVPPTIVPTAAAPTALPIALPELNLPSLADLTADGLKLSGTGEPGATVELWDGATRIGTAVVGADGVWSLVTKLTEGAHKLAVRTVDAAGNIINELPAADITVPKAIALPTLNLPSLADLTADGLKLSGTGEPGATLEVWEGATKIGTAVVGVDGIWTLLGKLGEGVHKLAVRTVDAAGNTLNQLAEVDVTVPRSVTMPTLNLPTAADSTVDGVNLSGTGQPGATVEVWEGATKVGTALVGSDGIWRLLGKLAAGTHTLVVRTVDAAGAIFSESPAVEIAVPEAQAPADDLVAHGEEYIVRWGDWLMRLARRFYGDSDLYTRIIDGTNAKAAVDSSFDVIIDANHIRAGQKLWIPGMPTGK